MCFRLKVSVSFCKWAKCWVSSQGKEILPDVLWHCSENCWTSRAQIGIPGKCSQYCGRCIWWGVQQSAFSDPPTGSFKSEVKRHQLGKKGQTRTEEAKIAISTSFSKNPCRCVEYVARPNFSLAGWTWLAPEQQQLPHGGILPSSWSEGGPCKGGPMPSVSCREGQFYGGDISSLIEPCDSVIKTEIFLECNWLRRRFAKRAKNHCQIWMSIVNIPFVRKYFVNIPSFIL